MESTSQLRCVLVCQFTLSFPTSKLCYKCFSYNDIFFMTLGLRSFVVCCITYGNNVWNNVWKLRLFLLVIVTRFLFRHNYVICLFEVVTFFDDVRITLLRSNYVRKWGENYVLFLFIIVTCFLVRYNYVIYLFNIVTFFDDVRNRFDFGTFELPMEITLQLHLVFVRHFNVIFLISQLSYLFVRCSYVFWWL